MLILDRYRLGTIVSQRRMIFLATDSTSGRPVWVHVIAEPVDSARQEIVKHAKAFIQAGGGQDIEDFLEYGYHDKTHYVITASRPECKELGPYLDTLLALRGIEIPEKAASMDATASGTIVDDRTQEITARLRRVSNPAASGSQPGASQPSGTAPPKARRAEPLPQDRTMSSQPTLYLRSDDVRQAIESGAGPPPAAKSPGAESGDPRQVADNPDDTETTIRFVRPQFADSGSADAFDSDQTAKVISPWAAKQAEAKHRADHSPARPIIVPAQASKQSGARKYPVWREQARPATGGAPPSQGPPVAPPDARPAAEPTPHQNGSGGHRLVLPPVRRGSPATTPPVLPASDLDPAAREPARRGSPDPKFLYMTLALVMVSLAAIALGLGWYIHTTANVAAPSAAAVAPAPSGGGEASGAAQPDASVPAAAAQAAQQQPGGASFSPLLLSIAFISAVLIFAAVVVLFMAVKRGA